MNLKHIYFLFIGILSASAVQVADQGMENPSQSDYLLKIGDASSDEEEFLYILNKNRQRSEAPLSRADFDENFELFVNYKLKVKYAMDLGLDKSPEFRDEFTSFKDDIIKPYLQENRLEEGEMRKVYERMQEVVKASHILLQFPPNASKEDSLAVFRMAQKLKADAENGADFSQLAMEYSEDPSAQSNKGNLGYFTALQMVLPFEEAAFNLSVGEISDPVLSDFGYHVIRLEERNRNPGQIRVSHLLIRTEADQAESENLAEKKITELYHTLQADPEQWPDLVATYSEDQGSKSEQGLIPWFGVGAIVPEFEKAAFSLEKEGDFSRPVKTEYGYHLIRLEGNRPVPPFEEVKPMIRSRILRDSKSEMIRTRVLDLQKDLLHVAENETLLTELEQVFVAFQKDPVNDLFNKLSEPEWSSDFLIRSGWKTAGLQHFISYLQSNFSDTTVPLKSTFEEIYTNYLQDLLAGWEEEYLYAHNPEYRQLINEYKNGMLLFELMNREVWQEAVEDTTGQQEYFRENKHNYLWEERIPALILKAKADKNLSEVSHWLSARSYDPGLETTLKEKFLQDDPLLFTFEQKEFEIQKNELLASLDVKQSFHQIKRNGESILILLGETIPSAPKKFEETRGKLIQDYQQYLENELLTRLKEKYTIQINEDEKDKIYRSLEK
ncbi:peptidylprolyl isomerase [Cyclobacterium plantarum]|uniref:Peptidylprolyl isomerase n=1 Tax=Cyclobacterium plantarum TaxID=2716263 RepID=A0ABX0H0Q3_9BACT|nr:peptidylprolyl isomerase [Cyclobacterium plantarum]NHE55363.1 peptidylprolyl isomerase [Cyclobacterium plantarum]